MAVRRTVEMPAVEEVEMFRLGRVMEARPLDGGDPADRRLIIQADEGCFLAGDRRAQASPGPGGDDMRAGIGKARPVSDGRVVILFDAPPALVKGDWLWVESER